MGLLDFLKTYECDGDCLACPRLDVDCDGDDFYKEVTEYEESEDD